MGFGENLHRAIDASFTRLHRRLGMACFGVSSSSLMMMVRRILHQMEFLIVCVEVVAEHFATILLVPLVLHFPFPLAVEEHMTCIIAPSGHNREP